MTVDFKAQLRQRRLDRKMRARAAAQTPDMNEKATCWNLASNPPKGPAHVWTANVVAATDLGRVFILAYMPAAAAGEGVWQRPVAMKEGEQVEYWIAAPYRHMSLVEVTVMGIPVVGYEYERVHVKRKT